MKDYMPVLGPIDLEIYQHYINYILISVDYFTNLKQKIAAYCHYE